MIVCIVGVAGGGAKWGRGCNTSRFFFVCVVAMVTAGAVRYVWRSSAETNRQVLF